MTQKVYFHASIYVLSASIPFGMRNGIILTPECIILYMLLYVVKFFYIQIFSRFVYHRLFKITERTLDVVFSRFISISYTITLRQNPKGVTRSRIRTDSLQNQKTERELVLRRLRVTPLGFCLRVIVNDKHINLKKTTYCVLSVILINLWLIPSFLFYVCPFLTFSSHSPIFLVISFSF